MGGIPLRNFLAWRTESNSFRSRDDFEQGDFRLTDPRFSEENFPKNLEVTKRLQVFAKKYNATPSQITLAWILAEHPNCRSPHTMIRSIRNWNPLVVPIPGIRSIERAKEDACGAELELAPEDVKAIRDVVESADVAGERYAVSTLPSLKGDCIPLSEWKGE